MTIAPSQKVFLTADWNYLFLANYVVPTNVLIPLVPKGCELALWDNQAFVSIVGFQFNNTRVGRIKWHFFTNFLEINLRFYLLYQQAKAVCFIREYVPSYFITMIARWAYNEPYHTKKITTLFEKTKDTLLVEYQIPVTNHPFRMRVTAKNNCYFPEKNSVECFFKEHNLGVGKTRKGSTLLYRVEHPEWAVFPIRDSFVEIDWEFFFGPKWDFLKSQKPHSVFLAKGSHVSVYQKG